MNISTYENIIRGYQKCIKKLSRLKFLNKNKKRQRLLEKRIGALLEQLSFLALKKKIAVSATVGALVLSGPSASAQITFGAEQYNPFNLTNGASTNSIPVLADFNNDGDLDILTIGGTYADFILYQNVGFPNAPNFINSPVVNPYGLTNPGVGAGLEFKVLVGDLDDDGDLDILRSEAGYSYYYQNTGTAVNAAFAAPIANPFGLVMPSGKTASVFVDLDGDGDLDIMGGGMVYSYTTYSFTESFLYFENIGTKSAPSYAAGVTNPFNLTSLGGPGFNPQVDFTDLDGDGDLDMISGRNSLNYYENIGNDTVPNFTTPIANPFGLTSGGSCSFGDLDNDGDMDIIARSNNSTYHIKFYENISVITNAKSIKQAALECSIYPNPTTSNVTLDLGEVLDQVTLVMSNHIGQVILEKEYKDVSLINLDIEGIAGVYFVRVETPNGTKTIKILKQ